MKLQVSTRWTWEKCRDDGLREKDIEADQSPGVHPGETGDLVPHVQGDCQGHLKPQTFMSDAGRRREQQKGCQRGGMQTKWQAKRWVLQQCHGSTLS